MKLLNKSNLMFELKKQIFENKKILGICVGMQILANSEEGDSSGLNLINASVKKLILLIKEIFDCLTWDGIP